MSLIVPPPLERRQRLPVTTAILVLTLAVLLGFQFTRRQDGELVIWAWERPEDFRFAPPGTAVAAIAGVVEVSGTEVRSRGRRFPLRLPEDSLPIAIVHIEIDRRRPPAWTPEIRARLADTVLTWARRPGYRGVQIDFEVRASERALLLDLLRDVRAGIGPEAFLSMTALASWCDTETWLDAAPVDEIVPMLFRMGPRGTSLVDRLAAGGDFGHPRCRTALGVSTDAPVGALPRGRRVYLFNPRSWTAAAFTSARDGLI